MSTAIPLPNFFVIGAAKCGTTSLHELVSRHPEVFASAEKETHFFDYGKRYARGPERWLEEHFTGSNGFAARGESTPSYLHRGDKVIPRMVELYGETDAPRLICLLRDPVERAYSHYLDMARSTLEAEPFDVALDLESERVAAGGPMRWRRYFGDGLYAAQLEPWIAAFGRQSLLLLLSEDLRARPRETLSEVFAFLGVRDDVTIDVTLRANVAAEYRSQAAARLVNRPSRLKTLARQVLPASLTRRLRDALEHGFRRSIDASEKPPLPVALAERLRARYLDDVTALEALLDRNLSHWKAPEPPTQAAQR
ncbi:MAG: sulfotransferase domain-containing protein [Pseudomonadota bacterium]